MTDFSLDQFVPSPKTGSSPRFAALAIDSEAITQTKPTLFICLTENPTHQPSHLLSAMNRGAVYCIAKEIGASVPPQVRAHTQFLEHALFQRTIGDLAKTVYQSASKKLKLFGVTGTNGKTTTAWFLQQLLSQHHRTGFIGTTGVSWPGHAEKTPWTTPESPILQSLFQSMHREKVTHACMEVSSIGLEELRLADCLFDGLIFTNLTQDHLDYHKTFERYYEAKKKFFLNYAAPSSTALLFTDDPYGATLARELHGKSAARIVQLGTTPASDWRLTLTHQSLNGSIATLTHRSRKTLELQTSFFARYNLQNLASAALCLLESKQLTETDIERSSPTLQLPPGRMERIALDRSANIFVDYAHTPDALENILKSLAELRKPEQKMIVVFGCGGDRDTTKRPLMGRVAASFSDVVILTADNSRSEKTEDILSAIASGIPQAYPRERVFQISDRREALAHAVQLLRHDDILVVAGKGHESTQTDQTGTKPFSDQEELRKLAHV